MQKIFHLLFFSVTLLWSIELDINYIQNALKEDPGNINNRLLLAKYYAQKKNYMEANNHLQIVLNQAPDNIIAKRLKQKIQKGLELIKIIPQEDLVSTEKIDNFYTDLSKKNQCNKIIELYNLFQKTTIQLSKYADIQTAQCFLQEGNVNDAQKILSRYSTKKLPLSLQAMLLAQNNDLYKASQLLEKAKKKTPQDKNLNIVDKMIRTKKQEQTNKLSKKVLHTDSLQTLQDYVYILNTQNKQQAAIDTVKNFIKEHPKNIQAKILLAKLYYWNGNLKKAFHTLYKYRKTDMETKKLYANILYEKGDYKHAAIFIKNILPSIKNKKEKYHFEKRLAFSYLYMQKREKASKIFQKLLAQNPGDKELAKIVQQNKNATLLQKANNLYKQKDYTGALSLFKQYYQETKDINIAKEIAEIYYFQKKYKTSLPYFKAYLRKNPEENLIRYHYATALEKQKAYTRAHRQFAKISHCKDQELCFLAKYHQSYNLMQTQTQKDWLKARSTLQALQNQLLKTGNKYNDLKKYTASLLKVAQGELRKPTYFKDIVLTEGAKKDLNPKTVFSNLEIEHTTNPSLTELLDTGISNKKVHKPTASVKMDYVKDSETRYRNYQLMIKDILTVNGIRYSLSTQKYLFDFVNHKRKEGEGAAIHLQKGKATASIGVKKVNGSYKVVPKLTWNPTFGIHNLFMDMYYQNGAFANYRGCMIKNDVNVLHAGVYDRILLDNLDFAELALSVNAFSDNNINFYGMFTYPLYALNQWGIEHRILFNENIDYNTKTKVCYQPASLYDSTYLIYNPKIEFYNGSMQMKVGKGYSFKNEEEITSYALQGNYTINKIASFELNCERIQSSFTSDDIDYCTFNIIQEW